MCIEFKNKQGEIKWENLLTKNLLKNFKIHNQAIKSFNKTVKHDNIKNNYCKTHNIKLIRIDYKNFKNIENILYKKILHTFN